MFATRNSRMKRKVYEQLAFVQQAFGTALGVGKESLNHVSGTSMRSHYFRIPEINYCLH